MKYLKYRWAISNGGFVSSLVSFTSCVSFAVLVFWGGLLTAAAQTAAAQPATESAAVRIPNKLVPVDDTRYRIGPGDVLGIVVRKAPELSLEAVRVDQRGMIRIPMIDDEVMAACRTENDLATQIADLYRAYKNFPSVNVFVREFQSRPVSVIGAVNVPGQFRLQRQVRVLELLSFAGGPSAAAGRIIDIIHTGGPDVCGDPNAPEVAAASIDNLGVLQLNDTLKGREGSNPFVKAGDIISLPEADQSPEDEASV